MASWTSDPQFSGMDPQLQQIYQNAGQTPAGRGTGFADWQYWQGVGPSQYGRLASDIAGTGTDQTTGTPWGAGAWQFSGQGQAQPGQQAQSPMNTSSAADQILAQVEGNMNGYVQQLLAQGGGQAQGGTNGQ